MPLFGTRKHLFASYLGEFMWKHEQNEKDLFEEIIQDISNTNYDGKDWGKSKLMTQEQPIKHTSTGRQI